MASFNKPNREFYRRLLYVESDRIKYFEAMSHAVSLGEAEKVKVLLDILRKEDQLHFLVKYKENAGESMLHIAAKFNQDSEIVELLIKMCPQLLTTARKESDDYFGQTALHIAIAKGNVDAVETMLYHSKNFKSALLHQLSTGSKFVNTIMMGELPLSVAAMTFRNEMVEALLTNGAEMDRQNTKGDTVFHTLIKFAAIYPDKLNSVLKMLEFLHEHIKEKMSYGKEVLSMEYDHSDLSYIWFVPNNDDLNALQLSAALSQTTIFQFVLDLPKVYCFLNSHDGLFDRKLYDITEIDTMATEKWAAHQNSRRLRMQKHVAPVAADGVAKQKLSQNSTGCSPFALFKREMKKSIMEMMFDIKSMAAFDFIQQSCVRQVIKQKWNIYRYYYYVWMIFHLAFMISLTAYAVYLSDDYTSENTNQNTSMTPSDKYDIQTRKSFLNVFQFVYLIIGALYLFHQIIHIVFRVKSLDPAQFFNVLHNGSYRAVLFLFSVCLIIEFILSNAMSDYENYTLIIALITGWWFVVFFLRAHKKFSFFTVMIQKVLFGDMLRFGIVIALFLVSFTAGLYMAFKGSEKEDFHTYGTSMMLLFKLMLGLGDIEDLYEARRPWLAVTLFIAFVLLAYVMMFNALIAMMSQTCNLVSENRHVQWRVQQLSIILFFEGILPSCMKKMVGTEKHVKRFDPNIKQVVNEVRYYLDLSSIQTEYANAEDIYAMKQKLQTLPFGDQQTVLPQLNLKIPTQHLLRSPRYSQVTQIRTPLTERRSARTSTEVNNSPTSPDRPNNDYDQSPQIKRRKSKREKSPSVVGASFEDNQMVENPGPSKTPKEARKRPKKKRIEPEGDNNETMEDHVPDQNLFYMNPHHLTVPNPINVKPTMAEIERQRHHSESRLGDTHIGQPLTPQFGYQPNIYPQQQQQQHLYQQAMPQQQQQQPKFPLRRVQLPVEKHSHMAPAPDGGVGALDIGVITDSYM